jgi:GTP-binding protein
MDVTFIASAFRKEQFPPADRPEIAFAGRSNVGKSSFINTLTNRKHLAKIGATPGKTRSVNFFLVNSRLYLVDLPGYGFARVSADVRQSWQRLVESYLKDRPTLKAVVLIMDIRRDPMEGDLGLLSWLRHYGITPILALTKADKLSRGQALSRAKRVVQAMDSAVGPAIVFSAKTREGRDEIWRRIDEVISGQFMT